MGKNTKESLEESVEFYILFVSTVQMLKIDGANVRQKKLLAAIS